MSDQLAFPTIPADDSLPVTDRFQHVVTVIRNAVNEVGRVIHSIFTRVADFFRSVVESARQVDRDYDRAALLKIYRVRATWKKGDVKNLLGYPRLNVAAQRRIHRLRSLPSAGRPAVARYLRLAKVVLAKLQNIAQLGAPNMPPHQRLAHLKQSMLWLYYVDALYRGEYLRRQGTPNASRTAEEIVAAALCISKDHLHRLRLDYRKRSGEAPSDAGLSLQEFEVWMQTGNIPK